jgi:16S rRNA (adenine1518-N6/adenine1519-N6)-dimethyltransferase
VRRPGGIAPSKALGQHFLTDWTVINRIVAAATPAADEALIEVGPGLGVLTGPLSERVSKLIAVEVDARLSKRLQDKYAASANVTIVAGDVLSTTPEALLEAGGVDAGAPYAVVGNLPYNIGAAILRRFLEAEHPPRWLVVMLQREVADSICAAPGEMSLLGVSVQAYATTKRLMTVPPRAFQPPPKVTSSVIRLDVRAMPLVTPEERDSFFATVRAGFSAPRKQLRNTLAQGLRQPAPEAEAAIEAAGIEPSLRPQMLGVEDWLKLSRVLEKRP